MWERVYQRRGRAEGANKATAAAAPGTEGAESAPSGG